MLAKKPEARSDKELASWLRKGCEQHKIKPPIPSNMLRPKLQETGYPC